MSFASVQVKRLERAMLADVAVGKYAIRATLPSDEYDRQIAINCANQDDTWEVRGNYIFALTKESAEYLIDVQEILQAEDADGYYANNLALKAVSAMMDIFGSKAQADRDASPIGFLSGMCA